MNKTALKQLVQSALEEDIRDGDHSSLACIPPHQKGKAQLLVKQDGILAGAEVAKYIFHHYNTGTNFIEKIVDGTAVQKGDIAFEVEGSVHCLLACERLVLNCMQRMSGIATYTHSICEKIAGTSAKLLDTRKTTPNFRLLEKEAVKIGGGYNHRFGLYDLIMLKDNHIDYAGGIVAAIGKTKRYLQEKNLSLQIEIEVRNKEELILVLQTGGVNRIMLDNFTPAEIREALSLINGKYETEASGGITDENILEYAKTGVDYISVGALTHQVKSLDLSLKAC